MQLPLKGFKFSWIVIALISECGYCAAGNSSYVSLTVEGGVSLVGPHCPGTVRLFCEGMDIRSLGWTYNGGNIIVRFLADELVTLFYPTNPAFVSVSVSNFSLNHEGNQVNYFSSVLTVDIIELNKQRIKSITCGDFKDTDTQQVDVSGYFTPNITAIYQSGILSSVEVQLQSKCPSLTYHISLIGNDTIQTRRCMGASCTKVFTEFPKNNTSYDLAIVATNHSYTLKEFNLTIAYHSRHYFIWTVNSTSCQQYSVQCTPTEAVSSGTMCSIKYMANLETPTNISIPLNIQSHLPYISQPATAHRFEFSMMVQEHLLIREILRRAANCGQPLFNPGVDFLITSTLENATVIYSCPGTGSSSSVCKPNGQWSPNTTLFTCPTPASPVTCGTPLPPTNGSFVDTKQQDAPISLSTGALVGVTLAGSAVVFTILGFLAGLLVNHLITRKKAVYSTAKEQTSVQRTVPVDPVYADVSPASKEEIELKSNQAYGPIGSH